MLFFVPLATAVPPVGTCDTVLSYGYIVYLDDCRNHSAGIGSIQTADGRTHFGYTEWCSATDHCGWIYVDQEIGNAPPVTGGCNAILSYGYILYFDNCRGQSAGVGFVTTGGGQTRIGYTQWCSPTDHCAQLLL